MAAEGSWSHTRVLNMSRILRAIERLISKLFTLIGRTRSGFQMVNLPLLVHRVFLLWQCAACSSKANTPNVNMWVQYHWYEAEIGLWKRLIALTRISRVRMRQEFADLLTKEKYNFQVVTARVARIVTLSVIIPCTSSFSFVSVSLNQTELHWRWRQHIRLKRQKNTPQFMILKPTKPTFHFNTF
jgi:hypothetical protein